MAVLLLAGVNALLSHRTFFIWRQCYSDTARPRISMGSTDSPSHTFLKKKKKNPERSPIYLAHTTPSATSSRTGHHCAGPEGPGTRAPIYCGSAKAVRRCMEPAYSPCPATKLQPAPGRGGERMQLHCRVYISMQPVARQPGIKPTFLAWHEHGLAQWRTGPGWPSPKEQAVPGPARHGPVVGV